MKKERKMTEKVEKNMVGWFEIPVTDMKRAISFYEYVLEVPLKEHKLNDVEMAWFPMGMGAPGAPGSLVHHKQMFKPSTNGVLIYFTTPTGDLEKDAEKVLQSGGRVLQPKTSIGDHGYYILVEDSEGNRVGIHSMKG